MSAAIRQALSVLSEPGQVIELRIPRPRHTRSGYFDDLDQAAEAAAKLNGTASVYLTLNPCNPALLARGANRIVEYPEATTSDRDILRRVWFPIDLDPVRPAGVSSTEAEHEAAIARAREVFGYLRSEGWPKPLVADSGNGAHLLYRIALPNDAESAELLKRCLQALALRFGDGIVSIDEKVFNAARIWKVYGTTACKGDHTIERPHRQANLLRVPDEMEAVPLDKLTALAGTAPKPAQRDPRSSGGERFDLDRWISGHGLDVAGPLDWSGGRKWIFRVCPWNGEHRNRSAFIVQFLSGAIAAGCQHNGCSGKDWAALRGMYEPEYREYGHRAGKAESGGQSRSGNGASPVGDSASPEWPRDMDPCAYTGIAGEIVNAVAPHTESDPVALLVQVLTSFGVLVGRHPYVQVEGDRHYPNLFALLIGETSKGRKGTSWGRVRSIFEHVKGGSNGWPRVVSGLSSGEGLKWQVRDERKEMVKDKKSGVTGEEVVDEGVQDKRLLVIEPEFAQVLRVVARHGNTLSSTARTSWDTGNLATLTKNDPITATGAHISIIGHVTVDELRAELTQTDTANGFANRFLFLCVKRSKCLPFGGADLQEKVLSDFAQRIENAAIAAKNVGSVSMTEAAQEVWKRVYPRLSEGMPGLFGAATARAEAQAVRLATIYTLMDGKAQIDDAHLLAGLAVWEYASASAQYVFGSSLGDPVADEILRAVRVAGKEGMTRTQIRDLFQRHRSAERIGAALDLLAQRKLARRRPQETRGRPSEVWERL